MKYELAKANKLDIEKLKKYKLASILDYADDMPEEEIAKIKNYVDINIPKQLEDYCLIKIADKVVGCLLTRPFEDGILLDEIFIESKYRHHGLGTTIISEVITSNKIVYLWVYKNNKEAIKLYQKLGFVAEEKTETRIFMKYSQNNQQ